MRIASTVETKPFANSTPSLLEQPLFTGGASGSWVAVSLRDLWACGELLYFLTWRDIKVRYKQTAMGAAWAIMQPLFTMLIFTIFFSKFVGVPSDGLPYPIFAYAGLLPWTFFANAVGTSSNSLIGSSGLITKVYFPSMIVPASAVAAGLLYLAIASVILIGLAIFYGVTATWGLIWLPLLVALTVGFSLGLGILVSALTVRYRDVRHALPFVIQLWMFASPIIYPSSVVPEQWRWALALNPFTGIIEGFRSALVGRAMNWHALSISAAITLALLIVAAYAFRRLEKSFADLL